MFQLRQPVGSSVEGIETRKISNCLKLWQPDKMAESLVGAGRQAWSGPRCLNVKYVTQVYGYPTTTLWLTILRCLAARLPSLFFFYTQHAICWANVYAGARDCLIFTLRFFSFEAFYSDCGTISWHFRPKRLIFNSHLMKTFQCLAQNYRPTFISYVVAYKQTVNVVQEDKEIGKCLNVPKLGRVNRQS